MQKIIKSYFIAPFHIHSITFLTLNDELHKLLLMCLFKKQIKLQIKVMNRLSIIQKTQQLLK